MPTPELQNPKHLVDLVSIFDRQNNSLSSLLDELESAVNNLNTDDGKKNGQETMPSKFNPGHLQNFEGALKYMDSSISRLRILASKMTEIS